MQIDFYANLPEDRAQFDVEFFADIYLDDDDDTSITVGAGDLSQEEFREQVFQKCLAGLLALTGDVLVVDGLVVDLEGEGEGGDDEDTGDWIEDFEEYLEDGETCGC